MKNMMKWNSILLIVVLKTVLLRKKIVLVRSLLLFLMGWGRRCPAACPVPAETLCKHRTRSPMRPVWVFYMAVFIKTKFL